MSRAVAVARLEFALQSREFLTGLYVAIFALLTGAFTSTHAVELVSDRGALPRNAPLVLAHAMAGVVAFGQVITTMIASTAVLRDTALRTDQLLVATHLGRREYLLGRFAGALAIMALVYLAVPLGLALGTVMPWAPRAELLPFDAAAYARPVAWLLVPDVLAVAAIFFAVGALARNFFAILLTGVALVALWQGGLALAAGATTGAQAAGALLDPFGNAALLVATQPIAGAARGSAELPVSSLLVGNRVLWLAIGAGALALTLARFRFRLAPAVRGGTIQLTEREASNTAIGLAETPRAGIDATRPQAVATGRDTRTVIAAADGRRAGGYAERWGREVHAWMRFTLITTLREKGFMALGLLATLNAAANAWTTSAPRAGVEQDAVLLAVTVHARLFFILVATIWAGELVWRERDLRVDGISDALPARSSAAVIGKLAGIHGAQAVLVALLALVAFMLPRLRGAAHAPSPWFTLGWSFGALLPAVALLTQGSLAVHALVQHKVAAHVLIIAAWVGAVAAAQAGTHVGLLTVSDLPALAWSETGGVTINWAAQARAVAFDFVRGTGLVLLAIVAWSRGLPRPVLARVRTAPARG